MFKRIVSAIVFVCALSVTAAAPAQAQGCRPGTSQSCPIPLRFARGSYGAMADGVLTQMPDARYYSINARAGQRMIITFTGLGAMRGGITYPAGGGDGPFDGQGTVITLPSNGTYIIYLGQNTMAGDPWRGGYTLSVLVR